MSLPSSVVVTFYDRLGDGKKGLRAPRSAMREFFISRGADPVAAELPEVQASLLKGTNEGQAYANEHIWPTHWHDYKQRVYGFTAGYLAAGGSIPKGKFQNAGQIHLLGWSTVIAFAKNVNAKDILPYLEASVQNGLDWKNSRLEAEQRISLPIWNTNNEPTVVPVLPVGYMAYFVDLLVRVWAP